VRSRRDEGGLEAIIARSEEAIERSWALMQQAGEMVDNARRVLHQAESVLAQSRRKAPRQQPPD
ncbi:MAG: hypothetical protein ACJ8G4_02740, partial [Burkholderiales bacterium]